uniref:Adenosine deaminase n=1 Tax=Culicoides sonorensis TaxID=179676 RepID=A0A336LR70_CULSO
MLLLIFLVSRILYHTHARVIIPLEQIRTNMITTEERMMEGGTLILSDKEMMVDNIIRSIKHREIDQGYHNLTFYAPSLHFFNAKQLIEQSSIFDIIKVMPKGSVLHLHSSASVSSNWIIKNLTYRIETEYCRDKNGLVLLTAGFHGNCIDTPVNIVEKRKQMNNDQIQEFDQWLENQISLVTEKPEIEFSDTNVVWNAFNDKFDTIKGLQTYLPFFKDYIYRMLEELYDDGILFAEIRTSFSQLYDKLGNRYDGVKTAGIMLDVVREFQRSHPDFIGLKAIFSVFRRSMKITIESRIKIFIELQRAFPNFVVGFDFVGQEDLGIPLIEMKHFIETLPQDTNLYFHAGETNWWGTPTDFNIIDAILLNTTRIGHGYALLKHPIIWNTVLAKGIAIEVSVISNQVLHLVKDLRNHPAAIYFALNIPVVITNDDPSFWGAIGVSYDWYYAFMALAPANSGLRLLKQLALNSIKYSTLTWQERLRFNNIFNVKWDQFLDTIIRKYRYSMVGN